MNSIGMKIRDLRRKLNLCQQDLCCDILSRTVLSKIENDKVTPSIYQLHHIANMLNVSMESLLNTSYSEALNEDSNLSSNNILFNLYQNKQFTCIISHFEKKTAHILDDKNCLFFVGFSYYEMEYYKESSALLNKYLKEFYKFNINDQSLYIIYYAKALNSLFRIMIHNSKYHKALQYALLAKKNLESHKKINHSMYHVVISNIGSLYCSLNRYDKCIDILEDFLSKDLDLINKKVLSSIHLALNISYYNLGDYDTSIKHIKDAIFLFNYNGDHTTSKYCFINYINALRYSNNITDAFKVLEEYHRNYPNDTELAIKFLIQEIILYFNIDKYDTVVELLKKVNINKLSPLNKNCYFFIKGHIEFINNNFEKCSSYLSKCERFFLKHNFSCDLKLLYHNLYYSTKNEYYKDQLEYFSEPTKNFKKNILCSNPEFT